MYSKIAFSFIFLFQCWMSFRVLSNFFTKNNDTCLIYNYSHYIIYTKNFPSSQFENPIIQAALYFSGSTTIFNIESFQTIYIENCSNLDCLYGNHKIGNNSSFNFSKCPDDLKLINCSTLYLNCLIFFVCLLIAELSFATMIFLENEKNCLRI